MKLQTTTQEIKIVKAYYTPEEYLELEAKADDKNEFRDGEIIPVTGGTTNHNKLALNLATSLNLALFDLEYEVYIGDVKLWIPRYRQFTYPDVMVIEGEPVYYTTNTTTVANPLLIAEVLSKSTKDYDQGDKFLYYRSIPEFKEYILIDQTQYYVMQYVKTPENQWILTEYDTESAKLNLSTIKLELSLKQLYKKVNFAENIDFSQTPSQS
ncbi:Uma2 family endonuclease [Nodularia spumigena]|jgi:Uma2 family endonuclease|uniref:Uma2 family endonuclease n=1 Tax=Nodularia spumigena UHCC 0060 TaxID=3110300 RepID=A0ABU5UW55_NODSP|nr:Uma2 family endonuclease [Nodularia spumigena]MEA5527584.1 Uma2 family endonuclease [Nodularia spumigena UHCC 0143]MEA5554993.1 Uma2 family endonuclease [Nodularia spumigena CH309]MEA5610517.1 Uma2 family endonuclease [Nodularia spumigena UHCC 0060]MEA5613645.1 Uma2 family endonuclease [Nodularia spumigena UHCC 0040]